MTGLLGDMASEDPRSSDLNWINPSAGFLFPGGTDAGMWAESVVLARSESAKPISMPPYPLGMVEEESTEGRLVRPPQLSRTL